MRIFLTGASGLLGINFALESAKQHTVYGTYQQHPIRNAWFQTERINLFDTQKIGALLKQWQPDWIVHCAALADINQCEADPTLAEQSNVALPHHLALLAQQQNIKFLYVSTDCVFDGKKDSFSETDVPHPVNIYGKTKLAGEIKVQKVCPDALIARVNFYGWSMTGTRSLAEWIIGNLRKKETIKGFQDIHFSPLLANSVATLLIKMMSENLSGLYHVSGNTRLSKYDFALHLAKQFGLNEKLITPSRIMETHSLVTRPLNIALNNTKLQKALRNCIPSFESDLQQFHQLEKFFLDQFHHDVQLEKTNGI